MKLTKRFVLFIWQPSSRIEKRLYSCLIHNIHTASLLVRFANNKVQQLYQKYYMYYNVNVRFAANIFPPGWDSGAQIDNMYTYYERNNKREISKMVLCSNKIFILISSLLIRIIIYKIFEFISYIISSLQHNVLLSRIWVPGM